MRRAISALVLAAAATGCTVVESADPAAAPESTRQQAPEKKGETTVKIRVVTRGGGTTVFVPVKVNGHGPYQFILDTGASVSAVDRDLADRLHLPETGETAEITGVTGAASLPVVTLPEWSLAAHPLHADHLPVIDLKGSASGLLGSDELRRFNAVRLDFLHSTLTLHDR